MEWIVTFRVPPKKYYEHLIVTAGSKQAAQQHILDTTPLSVELIGCVEK